MEICFQCAKALIMNTNAIRGSRVPGIVQAIAIAGLALAEAAATVGTCKRCGQARPLVGRTTICVCIACTRPADEVVDTAGDFSLCDRCGASITRETGRSVVVE